MTLRQLHAFVLVCQLGGFSRAAERMHVTQSAVTLLIKQLEAALGVILFDRSTRTLRLTSAAKEALPIAERILRNGDLLKDSLKALTDRSGGVVNLAVTVGVAAAFISRVVAAFQNRYPKITVALQDLSPDQLVMMTLAEEVEFSIGTLDNDVPDLDTTTLLERPLCVVCHNRSGLSSQKTVTWDRLTDQPVITIKAGTGIRRLIDETLAIRGKRLVPVYEVSLVTTALAMTAEGLGVSVFPPYLVSPLQYPHLITRPLIDPTVPRRLSIISKRGRTLSHASQSFIEVTRQTIGLELA